MAAGGSKKVIIISLLANFGIALSKLGGALFTGSAAMMAEAIHSSPIVEIRPFYYMEEMQLQKECRKNILLEEGWKFISGRLL